MKKATKETKFRHKAVRVLLSPLLSFFIRLKYKLKFKHYKALKNKGPFLILGNHTINLDPIIMGLHFPFPVYFIATEQIFNLVFLSRVLKYLVNPIKKSKSVSDIETIRKVRRIVNEGGSIGIFPEGNTTYTGETSTIQKSTVKLIKMLKIPVIILNLKGLYLSFPRWSIYKKRGPSSSYISKIILPDEYLNDTDDELYEKIKELLYVNAYDDQETSGNLYRGKKLAHGLEKLIFMDLKVNQPFVVYSKNNKLLSKISDFSLTYTKNGLLVSDTGVTKNLIELEDELKKSYYKYYLDLKTNLIYQEKVKLSESFPTRRSKKENYLLNLNKDSLVLEKEDDRIIFSFDSIQSIAMQGKFKIIIYLLDKTYLIKLDKYSSIYKYVLTYQFYQHIKTKGDITDDKFRQFGI
ncbi:lysophospholipid acyltransferase family protein [Acholeplasma granularum]|uniref:lysophospholipid acyltransferase family protein n=1 Tax=Acholeplasma granularum TaxID=264635 RepID=UPI00047138C1|nr:lysophospholipid acyltransferase family protein [Acholeplasma granularum]